MQNVKNMNALRDRVLEALVEVQKDPRRVAQAHEVGNLAGKVVGMCKVYLERTAMHKTKPDGQWDAFISGE